MNDLGWTLGWLAAQVACLLVPAIGIHALASRRGPTLGAWVATLSLGMVVLLGLLAFLPGLGRDALEAEPPTSDSAIDRPAEVTKVEPLGSAEVADRARHSEPGDRPFARFRLAWSRFEQQAAGPVARFRPWGKALAVVTLAGSGVGLLRLLVGLWAVGLCRRRGKLIDDPTMVGLVDELRGSMGCGLAVEVREVLDLTTPATAGWLRPILLLPGDWRGWDDSERRAVVAHELAHVVRGDYAAGLLARVAVVLNYYHPLVRWMAGRLHLEQELAADAMGARFAGGRSSYLLALSRLALKQDGRPSSWPARAFLPARGTLIRRIAMLKNETESKTTGQTWSKARRLATTLGLLALTIAVASWKAPAIAQDSKLGNIELTGEVRRASNEPAAARPFEIRFIPDKVTGVYAFRPAATVRRSGMGMLTPLLRTMMAEDLAMVAKALGVDTTRPDFVKLRCEDIESVVCGVNIGPYHDNRKDRKPDQPPLHTLEFSGFTVRSVAPFDWLGLLRQWKLEFEEVKGGRLVHYKLKLPKQDFGPFNLEFFFPDDRTLVMDDAKWIEEVLGREAPKGPTFLQGKDWEQAGDGLLAVALNNQDNVFSKPYDLGRTDDKIVLELFQGIDRWVIGVADADEIALRAEVTGRDPRAAEAVTRSIGSLVNLGRVFLSTERPASGAHGRAQKLYQKFLSGLEVKQDGQNFLVTARQFGTLADFAAIVQAEFDEQSKAEAAEQGPRNPKDSKVQAAGAEGKIEKR